MPQAPTECKSKMIMILDLSSPSPETASPEALALAAKLRARLDDLGIVAVTRWHEPVFTVEESRHLRGETAGAHTKNLFVKDKKGRLFLLVCKDDTLVDLKGVHRLVGAQGRVSFAGPDAMAAHLGVTPGSVTVFAAMNDTQGQVTVILDAALMRHETIEAHPLTNHATTSIGRDDLLTFLAASGHRPQIVDFGDTTSDGSGNGPVP